METPNDRVQRALKEKMAAAWFTNMLYWMGRPPFSARIAGGWQTESFIHEMVVHCVIGHLHAQRALQS